MATDATSMPALLFSALLAQKLAPEALSVEPQLPLLGSDGCSHAKNVSATQNFAKQEQLPRNQLKQMQPA